jgi:hypothetical protein
MWYYVLLSLFYSFLHTLLFGLIDAYALCFRAQLDTRIRAKLSSLSSLLSSTSAKILTSLAISLLLHLLLVYYYCLFIYLLILMSVTFLYSYDFEGCIWGNAWYWLVRGMCQE